MPTPRTLEADLPENDPLLHQVRALLRGQFRGVIFTGPPGTSKTWYASRIALKLVDGDPNRVRFVQFHPSYQYEDFVEGYVPQPGGGFRLKNKHLVEMCERAAVPPESTCVLVIDELSRVDPGRVFGECLTYLEMTKRGESFHLASGNILSIPKNLVFLATMNPMDRGVDEVDAALERRFAKIAMDPDPQMLDKFLTSNGMQPKLKRRVMDFFEWLRTNPNRACWIGQTYFLDARDEEDLTRLWNHQLRFHFEKAFRLDEQGFKEVRTQWERVFVTAPPIVPTPGDTTPGTTGRERPT
jgi:5-methylcytosine-specific restriction protein B